MRIKLKVGYSAAIVAFVGMFFVLASLELKMPLPGDTGVVPRILIFLASLLAAIGVGLMARWLVPDRIWRKVDGWRDYLENLPIPRFTLVRFIILIGIVGGECVGFFWLSENEKYIKPLFALLVCCLVISLNFLENSWVAIDQRQGKTARPSRTRFV